MSTYLNSLEAEPIAFRFSAILGHSRPERKIKPNEFLTRCMIKGEIHELIAISSEEDLVGAHYLGFIECLKSGVIYKGQKLFIEGEEIGTLFGFESRHTPNHMNVLIKAKSPLSGKELGLDIGDIGIFNNGVNSGENS